MKREELEKQLDEWLDRAAAEYGNMEARPGFETRTIANVPYRLQRRKWLFRWIPVSAAVTAILVFFVYVLRTEFLYHGTKGIASRSTVVLNTGPEQTLRKERAGNAAVPAANARFVDTRAKHRDSDKPYGRFLSSGLSNQERYLIAFAQAASERDITGLPDDHSFEPLQMPELEISFNIPDFEITSFESSEIEDLNAPTPGSEE